MWQDLLKQYRRRGPMLAVRNEKAFDSQDHIFEFKWDGMRAFLVYDDNGITLFNRRGFDVTLRFPEFTNITSLLFSKPVLLDGEIICIEEGRPSFQRLQSRFNTRPESAQRAAVEKPAVFMVFDLLLTAEDWTGRPLLTRKTKIYDLVRTDYSLNISPYILEKGKGLFHMAKTKGLEGIIAKNKNSLYMPGCRSIAWQKITVRIRDSFFLLGYVRRTNSRLPGSILIGEQSQANYVLVGQVGSGLRQNDKEYLALLETKSQPGVVTEETPRADEEWFWVTPQLVEVEYLERTKQGRLRHPVFKGWRRDIDTDGL